MPSGSWGRFGCLAAVVVSCSSGGSADPSLVDPRPLESQVDVVVTARVFDTQVSDVSTIPSLVIAQVRVNEALWALDVLESPRLDACMAEHGFDDIPQVTQRPPVGDVGDLLADRYGTPRKLPDGDHAYFIPTEDLPTQLAPATHDSNPAAITAFMGHVIDGRRVVDDNGAVVMTVSVGDGCLGQAQVSVFGSAGSYLDYWVTLNTVQVRSSQMLVRLLTDEGFVEANHEWSQCMRDAGFSFRTVLDPANSDWDYPRPGVRERSAARVDLSCRENVHLTVNELGRIERELEAEFAPDLPMTLNEFAAIQDRLITQATSDG